VSELRKPGNTSAAPRTSLGTGPVDETGHNIWLFFLVIFIWGASWFGIRFQIGIVPAEVSVAYRFALSSLIMFAFVLYTGRRMRFGVRNHVRFAIAGATMFSLNYMLFYYAAAYIVSGFLALIFSMASIFNLLNAWIIRGERPQLSLFFGAVLGVTGLSAIFLPSLDSTTLGSDPLTGVLLSVVATYSFSLGNIASAGYRERDIPVYSANAYAMGYGALAMTFLALVSGQPFLFDPSVEYVGSLLALAILATVIAFAVYVTLIGRIGAPRAGYVTVVFPLIALGISTVFEGYQWTVWGLVGLALVLAGNVIVLRK